VIVKKFEINIKATIVKKLIIEVEDEVTEDEAIEIAHSEFSVLNDDNEEKYEQELESSFEIK